MKRIYIAAYHQSKFGKLMGMSVPEILRRAVTETCAEIKVEPSAIDVGLSLIHISEPTRPY